MVELVNNNRYSLNARKYKLNEFYFNNITSEHQAYWLGFLYADGYIVNSDNVWKCSVTLQPKDKKHLIKFQQDLQTNTPIHEKVTKLNNKEYLGYTLQVNSKILVEDLYKYGCIQKKSLVIKPPNLPSFLIPHFIRGYFDGDGSIVIGERKVKAKLKSGLKTYIQKYVTYSVLGTNDLLLWIKNQVGIESMNYRNAKRDSPVKELRCGSVKECLRFYHYIYDNATIYLDRKYHKYKDAYSFIINQKQIIDPFLKNN